MHGNRLDWQRFPSSFSTHTVAIPLSDAGVPYAEDDFPTKRTETMPPETSPAVDEAPSRSIRKRILAVLLVIFLLVLLAPTIIAKTGLRDRLINAAIADDSLTASTQSASLGYLVPLSVQGFDLRADDGSLQPPGVADCRPDGRRRAGLPHADLHEFGRRLGSACDACDL